MTAWDAYTSGGATGDPNWMNITMPQTKDPFQKGILGADDMGPYAVYYILYEAVKRGLTEADPTTTDWELQAPHQQRPDRCHGSGQLGHCADAGRR